MTSGSSNWAEGFIGEENPEDTSRLDQYSRNFLEAAIRNYNRMFKTNYDTSGEKFQNYYKDVSQRVKNILSTFDAFEGIDNAFRDGFIQTTGTALGKVLSPVSRFTPNGERSKKRETVLEKLTAYFKKFWDISGGKLFR